MKCNVNGLLLTCVVLDAIFMTVTNFLAVCFSVWLAGCLSFCLYMVTTAKLAWERVRGRFFGVDHVIKSLNLDGK